MALVTCPDCQNEHSDAAAACPKCGRPVQVSTGRLASAAAVNGDKKVLVGGAKAIAAIPLLMIYFSGLCCGLVTIFQPSDGIDRGTSPIASGIMVLVVLHVIGIPVFIFVRSLFRISDKF